MKPEKKQPVTYRKTMKQNPIELKGETKPQLSWGTQHSSPYSTLLSLFEGRNRLEISKDVDELTTKQLDLIHKATSKAKCPILFKCTQNTKINNHFLGHETNLIKLTRTEII